MKKIIMTLLPLGVAGWLHAQCVTPVFTDNYSSTAGWSFIDGINLNGRFNITGGQLVFDNSDGAQNCANPLLGLACGREVRVAKALGTTLSNTSWRAECKVRITGGNGPGHMLMGMTSGAGNDAQAIMSSNNVDFTCASGLAGNKSYTNTDAIMASLIAFGTNQIPAGGVRNGETFPGTDSGWRFYGHAKNGNPNNTLPNYWPGASFLTPNNCNVAELNWSAGIPLPALNTDYWIRLERLSTGSCMISVYSDAAMTVHIPSSPQCFFIDENIAGLNTIQHATETTGAVERSLAGTLDDVRVFNNCPTNTLTATANFPVICSGIPVTLTASSNFTPTGGYIWTPGPLLGSPQTVTPTATTTYTLTATPFHTSCPLRTSVTVTINNSLPVFDPDFGLSTTSTSTQSPTYSVSAFNFASSNSAITAAGAGYWWFVDEIDPNTNLSTGNTMSNPPNWWTNSPTNLFPGYCCNTSITSGTGTFYKNKRYVISRGVWGPCNNFITATYIIYENSVHAPVNGNSFLTPSGMVIEKMADTYNAWRPDMPVMKTAGAEPSFIFRIAPNPTGGVLNVSLPANGTNSRMEVFSLDGKQVGDYNLGANTSFTFNLEEAGLTPGVYLLKVTDSAGNFRFDKVIYTK